MGPAAKPTRENRTITVDFQHEATYVQLLDDGKAFLECVFAFLLALGFQLQHTATCRGGGCLTRHSHDVRVRLGDLTICHLSPMALYRLVCAFGHHSLVTVLTRCGLPLPVYFLADEKHSRCLTDKVYRPTIVRGRVIWHLGYTEEASAAALTQSYGELQRAASQQEPSSRVRGILSDGFDSTAKSLQTLFPGVRLGNCLRHAINKLPKKLAAIASPVRQALRSQFHTLLYRARQRKGLRVFALGQRLRHVADPVAPRAGVANGERVRRWFQDKKVG